MYLTPFWILCLMIFPGAAAGFLAGVFDPPAEKNAHPPEGRCGRRLWRSRRTAEIIPRCRGQRHPRRAGRGCSNPGNAWLPGIYSSGPSLRLLGGMDRFHHRLWGDRTPADGRLPCPRGFPLEAAAGESVRRSCPENVNAIGSDQEGDSIPVWMTGSGSMVYQANRAWKLMNF